MGRGKKLSYDEISRVLRQTYREFRQDNPFRVVG